jgi:hypothetical protein
VTAEFVKDFLSLGTLKKHGYKINYTDHNLNDTIINWSSEKPEKVLTVLLNTKCKTTTLLAGNYLLRTSD